MSDKANCCRPKPDINRGIRLIQEGIQAQCVGVENFERNEIQIGREHTLFGVQRVMEGLLVIEELERLERR